MVFCAIDDTVQLPLYATTIGYWEHQEETARPAGFPDYQLHQILDGKGELTIKGTRQIAGPGDVFITFPDVPHSYTPVSREWELAWISFNGREAGGLLSYAGIRESGIYKLRDLELLAPLKEMLLMPGDNDLEINLERSKLLYAMLLDLKRNLPQSPGEEDELVRIKPVLEHIELHLHRTLTLKELAEVISVSPQYLCRLFQRTVHERPLTYINKQRINRSKQLMYQERDKKMYEIAQLTGFENTSYFCAVFKRLTGMKPEQFKQLHGLD